MTKSGMRTIEIDIDVYKQIIQRMDTFEETPNQVLRKVFELSAGSPSANEGQGLVVGGVLLPEGLEMIRVFKGEELVARVVDGKIHCKGNSYTSPSGAACAITKHAVNGWNFWTILDENGERVSLSSLRA